MVTRIVTRIDTLTEPPVIGQSYLVPCVEGFFIPDTDTLFWPVLGQPHSDKEVGFDKLHFHYDWRFMPIGVARQWGSSPDPCYRGYRGRSVSDEELLKVAQNRVCTEVDESQVMWLEKECLRHIEFPSHLRDEERGEAVIAPFTMRLEAVCAGRRLNLDTLQCPHKGISLAQTSVVDGCITCPAHGLRWDATTGELVSRYSDADRAAQAAHDRAEAERQRVFQTVLDEAFAVAAGPLGQPPPQQQHSREIREIR